MVKIMETFIEYFKKPIVRKIFILVILGFAIYLLRGMATLLLLTFVFIYIFNSLQNLAYRLLSKLFPIKRLIITIVIYILFISLFAIIISIYLPILITQISALIANITDYLTTIKGETTSDNIYSRMLIYITNNFDFSQYISKGGTILLSVLTSIGTVGLYILLSIVLSFFYMTEKKGISDFSGRFKKSKLYWMYDDTFFFFRKFAKSFGKVIQNQILISFINSVLSVIVLIILGFPYVLGLGAMIFILGMVPVAGVFISLIPLSIIAYTNGGLIEVIYILLLILVLHSLESYVLNPKLMSHTSKMPVFFTFLVLLISEHLFGTWGLIIGIPLTMFLLDMINVIPTE
jgi:predicted PurR-regulated permease PerM